MALRVGDFEIDRGDVVFVPASTGAAQIEAMFYAYLAGQVAVLSRLEIQGGRNTLGWVALHELAQSVMELPMSTNSESRARFARLGPVRDADPPPRFPASW